MSEPGPVMEEAAKLLEALTEWARHHGGSTLDGLATGAPECRLCPVCQLIGIMRSARPETYEHLLAATTSMVAAMRSALEAHERAWAARADAPVEHIDIG